MAGGPIVPKFRSVRKPKAGKPKKEAKGRGRKRSLRETQNHAIGVDPAPITLKKPPWEEENK